MRLQVVDKDGDDVMGEIEAAMYNVAASILGGEGFAFDVPSRAKGNQVRGTIGLHPAQGARATVAANLRACSSIAYWC